MCVKRMLINDGMVCNARCAGLCNDALAARRSPDVCIFRIASRPSASGALSSISTCRLQLTNYRCNLSSISTCRLQLTTYRCKSNRKSEAAWPYAGAMESSMLTSMRPGRSIARSIRSRRLVIPIRSTLSSCDAPGGRGVGGSSGSAATVRREPEPARLAVITP